MAAADLIYAENMSAFKWLLGRLYCAGTSGKDLSECYANIQTKKQCFGFDPTYWRSLGGKFKEQAPNYLIDPTLSAPPAHLAPGPAVKVQ